MITVLAVSIYEWAKERRWPLVLLVVLLVVVWEAPYLYTWDKISARPEDQDYFFQAYEAIRKTIVEYHQFPWMNPWVGGGVPLFANPQVGVFSLQTILVLLFGTVPGLKISIILYSLLGMFGAVLLFRQNFKTSLAVASLLAFCWISNGFFIAHLPGHYSFVYFLLFPLALHLQLNILRKRYAYYYGGLVGLMALASIHYAFLQMFLILSVVGIGQLAICAKNKHTFKSYILKFLIVVFSAGVLALIRAIYTLQYVFEYPRTFNEGGNTLKVLLFGLFTPGDKANFIQGAFLKGNSYGSWEYSAYVGVGVGMALVACLAGSAVWGWRVLMSKSGTASMNPRVLIVLGLLTLTVLFGSVALGGFASWAPWNILHNLPGFSSTRVPSRWLLWVGLAFLCMLAVYSTLVTGKMRKILVSLLCVAVFELYTVGFWYPREEFTRHPIVFRSSASKFVQYERYTPDVNSEQELNQVKKSWRTSSGGPYFAYESTSNNIGELYGYEPVYTTQENTMGRCGVNSGCNLVVSGNATVEEWSPNKIILKRTGSGSITLDIAPSNYWLVNNVRVGNTLNTTGPGNFVIPDPSSTIVIVAKPKSLSEIIRD